MSTSTTKWDMFNTSKVRGMLAAGGQYRWHGIPIPAGVSRIGYETCPLTCEHRFFWMRYGKIEPIGTLPDDADFYKVHQLVAVVARMNQDANPS